MNKLILGLVLLILIILGVAFFFGAVKVEDTSVEVVPQEEKISEASLIPAPTRDAQRPPLIAVISKDGTYTLSGTSSEAGGTMAISIIDNKTGKIWIDDIIEKNNEIIGYNKKFMCQCNTFIDGWYDDRYFGILIQNGGGEEYTYKVDAQTGLVDENSFRKL